MCIFVTRMKPIVALGDVHGLTYWKTVVEEHPGCRYVFLGDYLDPYGYIPRKELLRNLFEIILLKKLQPDDVVLLLGNHDLHYLRDDAPFCSRYDWQIADAASRLFRENAALFQNAYQEEKTVFTHAGISQAWFEEDFKGDASRPIADQLNAPSDEQLPALFRVGEKRGGRRGARGGIFWADITELDDPLHGFTQVVGHNRVREVTEHEGTAHNKIIFCDCLFAGKVLVTGGEASSD